MNLHEVDAAFAASPLFQELNEIGESNDFSRFESQAKRHHFVPQLLLREFARSKGQVDYLFQLDVTTGRPQRTTTEAAASRRYLYAALEEDGASTNWIEGFLALVESHAAPVLVEFLERPALSDGDRDPCVLSSPSDSAHTSRSRPDQRARERGLPEPRRD